MAPSTSSRPPSAGADPVAQLLQVLTDNWQSLAIGLAVLAALQLLLSRVLSGGRKGGKAWLDPETYKPLPLAQKLWLNHNTLQLRFDLPSAAQRVGLPIGQHISFMAKVSIHACPCTAPMHAHAQHMHMPMRRTHAQCIRRCMHPFVHRMHHLHAPHTLSQAPPVRAACCSFCTHAPPVHGSGGYRVAARLTCHHSFTRLSPSRPASPQSHTQNCCPCVPRASLRISPTCKPAAPTYTQALPPARTAYAGR